MKRDWPAQDIGEVKCHRNNFALYPLDGTLSLSFPFCHLLWGAFINSTNLLQQALFYLVQQYSISEYK